MLRGFRFTTEKSPINVSIHLCLKTRSQYVKLVYKIIIHKMELWKEKVHTNLRHAKSHLCTACVLALNVELSFYVFKMDVQANLYSNQASGKMGCNCGWICIAVAGTESQLEVYYDFPTLSLSPHLSSTPYFWLKCENSTRVTTGIFWECRHTMVITQMKKISWSQRIQQHHLKSGFIFAKLLTLQLFNMQKE